MVAPNPTNMARIQWALGGPEDKGDPCAGSDVEGYRGHQGGETTCPAERVRTKVKQGTCIWPLRGREVSMAEDRSSARAVPGRGGGEGEPFGRQEERARQCTKVPKRECRNGSANVKTDCTEWLQESKAQGGSSTPVPKASAVRPP